MLSGIHIIAVTGAILLVMVYGQSILIPIILALVITFIIDDITLRCSRIHLAGYALPRFLARTLAIGLIVFGLLFVIRMAVGTGGFILERIPVYRENLNKVIDQVPDTIWTSMLGETATSVDAVANELFELGYNYLISYISSIVSDIANLFVQAFIIFFYIVFLLSEQDKFVGKLSKMFPDPKREREMRQIFASISTQSRKYIAVKTYVSILTGVGSFLVMAFFGIEFATFWAILIFMLNYIPYVGSIIAVIFPVGLSLFQFGDFSLMGILFVALTGIQVLVSYIFEPIIMGNNLDISAFVVLVSLSIFGAIWGVVGMIIAIPIVIVLIIVLGHFDSTRPFAVLLTGNGDLDFKLDQDNQYQDNQY